MPTSLGVRYIPSWNSWPYGMSKEDGYLYWKWKALHQDEIRGMYFNVRVGSGKSPGPNPTAEERETWYQCTAKRIDMIVLYDTYAEIVEFRDNANANAIGRLLCYDACYKDDPVLMTPVGLKLVTNVYDPDVRMLCEKLAIEYEVFA